MNPSIKDFQAQVKTTRHSAKTESAFSIRIRIQESHLGTDLRGCGSGSETLTRANIFLDKLQILSLSQILLTLAALP